jgi:hypothetical protein
MSYAEGDGVTILIVGDCPMKASDIDKVQSLLDEIGEHNAWLALAAELLSPKPGTFLPEEFVVEVDNDQLAVPVNSDVGREILALLKRYTEDRIAAIEAQLRALGVEP